MVKLHDVGNDLKGRFLLKPFYDKLCKYDPATVEWESLNSDEVLEDFSNLVKSFDALNSELNIDIPKGPHTQFFKQSLRLRRMGLLIYIKYGFLPLLIG